jgi:hypothetical protein
MPPVDFPQPRRPSFAGVCTAPGFLHSPGVPAEGQVHSCPFGQGTMPCPSIVPTYRSLYSCQALPFLWNMNDSIQHGHLSHGDFPPRTQPAALALPRGLEAPKSQDSNRCSFGGSFAPAEHPPNLAAPRHDLRHAFAFTAKINRHTFLLGIAVSYRKQRTDQKLIATKTSFFCAPSKRYPTRQTLSHRPRLSNRKPELIESPLSPAISTAAPVLIANFEPNCFAPPHPPRILGMAIPLCYSSPRGFDGTNNYA